MSEALELSKRLEALAIWLDYVAFKFQNDIELDTSEQWAADIRSLIIPQPGERDES